MWRPELWHTLGALLGTVGVAMLARAVVVWRRPAVRRCPKCRYDMRGLVGLVCPECGRTATSERAMLRRPGQWAWVALAWLAGMAGYVAWKTPELRDAGWPRAVPTWALMLCLSPDGDYWRRGHDGVRTLELSESAGWAMLEFYDRVSADPALRPYARAFVRRTLDAHPEMLRSFVGVRPRWPRHQPIAAVLSSLDYLQMGGAVIGYRLRVSPTSKWSEGLWYVDRLVPGIGDRYEHTALLDVPPEALDTAEIEIELVGDTTGIPEYTVDRPFDARNVSPIWRSSMRVSLVASAKDLIRPVNDPNVDCLVIDALKPKLLHVDNECVLKTDSNSYHIPFGDLPLCGAIGARVLVLCRGMAAATGELLFPQSRSNRVGCFDSPTLEFPLNWFIPPPTDEELATGDWRLIMWGDAELALRDIERDSYWAGSFEVVLSPELAN